MNFLQSISLSFLIALVTVSSTSGVRGQSQETPRENLGISLSLGTGFLLAGSQRAETSELEARTSHPKPIGFPTLGLRCLRDVNRLTVDVGLSISAASLENSTIERNFLPSGLELRRTVTDVEKVKGIATDLSIILRKPLTNKLSIGIGGGLNLFRITRITSIRDATTFYLQNPDPAPPFIPLYEQLGTPITISTEVGGRESNSILLKSIRASAQYEFNTFSIVMEYGRYFDSRITDAISVTDGLGISIQFNLKK